MQNVLQPPTHTHARSHTHTQGRTRQKRERWGMNINAASLQMSTRAQRHVVILSLALSLARPTVLLHRSCFFLLLLLLLRPHSRGSARRLSAERWTLSAFVNSWAGVGWFGCGGWGRDGRRSDKVSLKIPVASRRRTLCPLAEGEEEETGSGGGGFHSTSPVRTFEDIHFGKKKHKKHLNLLKICYSHKHCFFFFLFSFHPRIDRQQAGQKLLSSGFFFFLQHFLCSRKYQATAVAAARHSHQSGSWLFFPTVIIITEHQFTPATVLFVHVAAAALGLCGVCQMWC